MIDLFDYIKVIILVFLNNLLKKHYFSFEEHLTLLCLEWKNIEDKTNCLDD
jgi:hypothetical protein